MRKGLRVCDVLPAIKSGLFYACILVRSAMLCLLHSATIAIALSAIGLFLPSAHKYTICLLDWQAVAICAAVRPFDSRALTVAAQSVCRLISHSVFVVSIYIIRNICQNLLTQYAHLAIVDFSSKVAAMVED